MESAASVLADPFGMSRFRTPQREVIERVVGGGHALVIMPTGSGKSLCFQIPAVLARRSAGLPGRTLVTLVVSPLIALMKDQVDALVARNVSAAYVNSSLGRGEREARYRAIAAGEYDLVYVTPERFRKPEFVEAIGRRHVALLAVDEAHSISEWGHDFRPDYTRLAEFRQMIGNPTTIALTATATPEVQTDIIRQLGLAPDDVRLFHQGIERPNLELAVETVLGTEEKLEHIAAVIDMFEGDSGSGIIYFTLIKTLQAFSERLVADAVPHVCYHGDLPRDQRRRVQNEFMQGRSPLVLATNAFGMGIDKEDIRFVTHAEVPGSLEAYYQEIGRAGRDGRPSRCTLLYDQHDLMIQMQFIDWSNPDSDFYQRTYRFLTERSEEVRAFGLDWLNGQLQSRSRHDHRLETALSILDRHSVIAGARPPECYDVLGELPEFLRDDARLAAKRRRDQQRLYTMVEYAAETGDRKAFIHRYFGLGDSGSWRGASGAP